MLGLERVERDASFFHLGGHSLSATRLVARVRQSFGVQLPLASFFSSPSVAGLSRELASLQASSAELPPPTPLPPGAPLALSPAQERLWFIHQLQPDSGAYHIPQAVELKGAVDIGALDSSLRWLLERHPVLRTTVSSQQGQPHAELAPVPAQVLQVEDGEEALARQPGWLTQRLHQESWRPFSLARGPLYRFLLLKGGGERHVLLACFHHLVVDGLSLDILFRELGEAYAALHQGQQPPAPPVPLHYSDVAAWQRSDAVHARDDAQLAYWTHHLASAPRLLQLPTDKPR
ncbi:condensation domain-containing protein, partial [Pyxidicoccus sp. 3LG]